MNQTAADSAIATQAPRWAGYAAALWAGVFAAISLYWALGGTVGIDTVGGQIAELARSGDSSGVALAWAATLLKIAGVVYALALVQPWGRVFPRRLMLVAGWAGVALLVAYGLLNVGGGLLVATGLFDAPADVDRYALYWHLALWEPYFVVWGVLLGIAVHHYAARTSPTPT